MEISTNVVYQEPTKDKIVKGTYQENHFLRGLIERPIYKDLNELDTDDLKKYNQSGVIYGYNPNRSLSDDMGIIEYKLIGATKKNRDKRTLLIVEDMSQVHNMTFKYVYLEIVDDVIIYCGRVMENTMNNFNSVNIGDKYKGWKNSGWLKLDVNNFVELTGKIYKEKDFSEHFTKL